MRRGDRRGAAAFRGPTVDPVCGLRPTDTTQPLTARVPSPPPELAQPVHEMLAFAPADRPEATPNCVAGCRRCGESAGGGASALAPLDRHRFVHVVVADGLQHAEERLVLVFVGGEPQVHHVVDADEVGRRVEVDAAA